MPAAIRWMMRLLLVATFVLIAACGGSGSGGSPTPEQPSEPPKNEEQETPEPTDHGDPRVDFSPAIPTTGAGTSIQNDVPVTAVDIAYPEGGIPAGRRVIVSAYRESADTTSPGDLAWRRQFVTQGESSKKISEYPTDYDEYSNPNEDVTLLIDVVVFNDQDLTGPKLEYATIPRSRVEFVPQEQAGQTTYEGVSINVELAAIDLSSTPAIAQYTDALSAADDSNIVVEHSSFYKNTLYLLVNYSQACGDDDLEVQFQISDADLDAKKIPTAVRRATEERCEGEASQILTVPLDEVSQRYASFHNTVFDNIELVGIGSFRPATTAFDREVSYGTSPICEPQNGCLALAVFGTDGRVNIESSGGLSWRTEYSVSPDGRTIYLQAIDLIPPNSYASLSEDGQTASLSFIGFTFRLQPSTYTSLTLTGSITPPALDDNHNYHAAVVLFAATADSIDILAGTEIANFSADNANFSIEYEAEGLPAASPLPLHVAAAVFSNSEEDSTAVLEFKTNHPGDAVLFNNTGTRDSVYESQAETAITVTEFQGPSNSTVTQVIQEDLSNASSRVTDLQFGAIIGNYLHLILGGDSACAIEGGEFHVTYRPEDATPSAGLPSRWISGPGTPCVSSSEAHVSIDLKPLITTTAERDLAAPQMLKLEQYGNYTPVLSPFTTRRVYVSSAGCFAQNNCDRYLDFGTDGIMRFKQSTLTTGSANYGVSVDGRTIFALGLPLSEEASRAFLSEDELNLSSAYSGELVLEQVPE